MRLFLSYNFRDLFFVSLVNHYLQRQRNLESFFYSLDGDPESWRDQLARVLGKSGAFVLFLGSKMGNVQTKEMAAIDLLLTRYQRIAVYMAVHPELNDDADRFCDGCRPIRVPGLTKIKPDISALDETEAEDAAEYCAQEIVKRLDKENGKRLDRNRGWIPVDPPPALPDDYPFDYEKKIIDEFVESKGSLRPDKGRIGCTLVWPAVVKRSHREGHYRENPIPPAVAGEHRDSRILVDARVQRLREEVAEIWKEDPRFLTFPEAGPRAEVCFPLQSNGDLRVGILVSGGIAPGINAVIDGIVRRHTLYADPSPKDALGLGPGPSYTLEILGFIDGLSGVRDARDPILLKRLLRGRGPQQEYPMHPHAGGSILRTSRDDELLSPEGSKLMEEIVRRLTSGRDRVDILYVIGGDGSMRAAHEIYTIARRKKKDLSVVTIPKTMDNDILWVWQSFGFLSAVEQAKQVISQLYLEASSNPRLGVIQLYGSDSGFVASHAALTSGVCDYVLIPEVGFTMQAVINHMKQKLEDRRMNKESPYGIVVMAETAIPLDYPKFYKTAGLSEDEMKAVDLFVQQGRVHGQTPDELRSAALKIVANSLKAGIRRSADYWQNYRVFTNEPRHLIRSIPPSALDVVFGERLGTLAVDGAMAGYTDFMVSQWLTEYVFVPLKLVVLGRKRLPPKGIFWRTVLAKIGQPDEGLESWAEKAAQHLAPSPTGVPPETESPPSPSDTPRPRKAPASAEPSPLRGAIRRALAPLRRASDKRGRSRRGEA